MSDDAAKKMPEMPEMPPESSEAELRLAALEAERKWAQECGTAEFQLDVLESARRWAEERAKHPGWPDALVKANVDPFDYGALVVGLGVVRFESAVDTGGGWVRLTGLRDISSVSPKRWRGHPFSFGRGVEVRLEDIRWVADAPHGS